MSTSDNSFKISSIFDYVASKIYFLFDVFLLLFVLQNIISRFNIGIINIFFQFIIIAISFLVSINLVQYITSSLKLTDPIVSCILIVFMWVLFIYTLSRLFIGRSSSFLDNIFGGIYGAIESLGILVIINYIIISADENNFPIPKWIKYSYGIEKRQIEDVSSQDEDVRKMQGTLSYKILVKIINPVTFKIKDSEITLNLRKYVEGKIVPPYSDNKGSNKKA